MDTNNPKISVIVPVYNVEKYLEECLDSLVNQTLEDIEVIMVNDGSTDDSGKIMDRYAEMYPNFKAYHKPNGGLGQARNYGMQYVTGDYIAFVDSDDYLKRSAYKKMYELAMLADTDIVIGNVKRFNSTKEYASGLHKKVFSETILRTHITESNELMYDTTAWNKLFKRSFWEKHQFKFPEGILYEDLPVTIPAHYLSSGTSVLSEVIYYWRARDAGDRSITQQRHELVNFTDRFKVLKMLDAFFDKHNIEGELREVKDYKALSLDILLYLKQLDIVDEEFLEVFMKDVGEYVRQVPKNAFNRLNSIDRLKYYLIEKGETEKMLKVLEFEKTKMKKTKIIKSGNLYLGNYPYRNELPKELFELNDELQVVRKLEKVKWNSSTLEISGYHYIGKIDIKNKKSIEVTASLKNPDTNEKVDIPVEIQKRTDVTHKHGIRVSAYNPLKRLYNYDYSGFSLSIDFKDEAIIALGKGRLELWFTIRANGIEREYRAGGPIAGKKTRPTFFATTEQRIFPKYNAAWDLVVETDILSSIIRQVEVDETHIKITGETTYSVDEVQLKLSNYPRDYYMNFDLKEIDRKEDKTTFYVQVPIELLKDDEEFINWVMYLEKDEEIYPFTVIEGTLPATVFPFGKRELNLEASPAGNMVIRFNKIAAHLTKMSFTEKTLKVSVGINDQLFRDFSKIEDVSLLIQHVNSGKIYSIPYTISFTEDNSYRILHGELELLNDDGLALFDIGIWKLYFEISGNTEKDEQYTVIKKRVKLGKGLSTFDTNINSGIKLIPYRTKLDNFSIKAVLHWDWIERGPRRQEIFRRFVYPIMRRVLPINKKTVVFQSYWGKSYSCNPRAIYEQMIDEKMNYNYVWFFNNENKRLKGKGESVRINSWKYYYYLATAKYFINNANFPDFYHKRSKAVEVQTLHGTPLKTMGIDVPGEVDTETKLAKFLRRCGRWDYLTSPSRYVTELSKRVFVYKKEVLEFGFPRNDKLFRENNEGRIAELKKSMGLPEDKKIVLYAPTWRTKKNFKLKLELDKMQEVLGDEYIVILRLHYFVANSLNIARYKNFAYNFSFYDDIQDIYLVSDLMITDYSSVMFDYAILNRPMLFFTYDLEAYRDQLRGMYLDFEQEAPGPLLRTTDELIDQIKNINRFDENYGKKFEDFREKYCQFDDGNASLNVIKSVFK